MSFTAKILIVDDHHLVRHKLRLLLAAQAHWKIYDAANGKTAIDLTREIRPDVIVMDIVMPGMSGIEAAYEVRRLAPETKIILTSSHYTPEEAALLARLFGDGNFIAKSEAAKELVPAVSRVLPAECQVIDPTTQRPIAQCAEQKNSSTRSANAPAAPSKRKNGGDA